MEIKCYSCFRFIDRGKNSMCEHPNGFKIKIPADIINKGCGYHIDKSKVKK